MKSQQREISTHSFITIVMSLLKRGCRVTIEGVLDKKQLTEYTIRFDMLAVQSIATRKDFPYFESKPIIFFESEWIVYVYPNGFDKETISEVKVVLVGVSKTKNMKVEYTLMGGSQSTGVLGPKEMALSSLSPMEAIAETSGDTKNLFNSSSMYLSTNGHFELKLLLKRTDDFDKYYSGSSMHRDHLFRDRLFHKDTSDVDIVVEGTRIPAHKLILSLASPVFTAMFENQMQECVNNEIVIFDFSEEVVRSMLRCIYDSTAVVSEIEKHADQLLFIANKYELTEIEDAASNYIVANITQDNAIIVLQSADKFDRAQIKSAAMNFIIANLDHFFILPDFITTLGVELTAELQRYMITNKRVKF